ncbi:MAG: DUF2142 domain-containing protein [Pseudolysinimonas sp.]
MRLPWRGLASSLTMSRLRWPAAVFASLLTLLLTWAIATPRYGAPDELSHTIKAYATAHGQLLGTTTPGTSSLIRTFNVPKSLVSAEPWCFASFPEANAGCAVPTGDTSNVAAESSAATYPIPYYAVIGTAVRAIGASDSARAYRLISIGLSTLVLTAAMMLFRRSFGSHSAVVLLAVNPMAVFVMTSMNPATLEVSGMLVLWAFLGYLLTRDAAANRNDLLIASAIGAALVVVRPVSLPWVIIAVAGFFVLEWRPLAIPRRHRNRDLAVTGIPITLAVLGGALWSRFAGVGLSDDKFVVTGSAVDIGRVAIGRTALLLRQGFGTLGWLDTQLPSGIYGMWLAVIVCAASAVLFFGDRRTKLLMFGLIICWIAYPVAYATLARTPAVWQGRYNLPLLGGLAMCALVAVTTDQRVGQARQLARLCAGVFVLIDVVALHQSLRRFMVGASGDILLRSPGWSPRFNPWLLLIVNLTAAAVLAALMLSAQPAPVDRGTQL